MVVLLSAFVGEVRHGGQGTLVPHEFCKDWRSSTPGDPPSRSCRRRRVPSCCAGDDQRERERCAYREQGRQTLERLGQLGEAAQHHDRPGDAGPRPLNQCR